MRLTHNVLLVAVAAALVLSGCIGGATRAVVPAPETARVVEDKILWAPTTWSGDLRIVRPLIVTRTASLTLQPGTRLFFDLPEPAEGEKREPWILIQGSLVALGSPEQPIRFTSVALRNNELDDVIQVQGAKEVHLRNCVFERGPWAVHTHDTTVEVRDSVFRDNYGGVRFQGGRVELRGNRFADNRIGVRCLKSSPVIEENEFTDNLTGIFFREGVADPVLRHNNFDNREYDLKLGEAQTEDVDAAENWWAAAAKGSLEDRIFDGGDSEGIGFVATDPMLPEPWGPEEKR